MMRFEEDNLYPHEQVWNLLIDMIEEDCPISFSVSMMCYGMVAMLCQIILPYFFSMFITLLKIEWPVLDPAVMFGWSICGHLTIVLILLGVVESTMGLKRWVNGEATGSWMSKEEFKEFKKKE